MSHYAEYRLSLLDRILSEGLSPIEVARELRTASAQFKEIDYVEIMGYERMGQWWGGIAPKLEDENEVRGSFKTVPAQGMLSFPAPEPEALPAAQLDFPPVEGS